MAPLPDRHGHTPRTEQLTHDVADVERIPVDAQNLSLTDLTVPGLSMAASLNPDRKRHRLCGRIMLVMMRLPTLIGLALNAADLLK